MTQGGKQGDYPFRSQALVVGLPVAPLVGCVAGLVIWLALNGQVVSLRTIPAVLEAAFTGYVYTLPVSVVLALLGFSVLRLLGQTGYLAFGLAGLVLSPAALIGTSLILDLWRELPDFIALAVIVSVLTALTFRLLLEPFRKRPKQVIY